MQYTREAFFNEIQAAKFDLTENQAKRAAHFAEILHRENENQNLTRILGIKEFVWGHLKDVLELFHVEQMGMRVLDIGSGCGVPGLLGAAIDESERIWFLTDSESSKAEYLKAAAAELGLKRVAVFTGRVEECIQLFKPDTVMARAVGTVEKIANWIWNCSTWNNLILFKSKGWEEEWKNVRSTKYGKKLTVLQAHEYSSEDKYRVLVTLKRK